jgi:hypothetical protein
MGWKDTIRPAAEPEKQPAAKPATAGWKSTIKPVTTAPIEQPKPEVEANLFETQVTTPEEIEGIAKKYNIPSQELFKYAEFLGARTDTSESLVPSPERVAGFVGRGLLNIPQFAVKKLESDENTRKAMDELQELARQKRSWAEAGAELLVPGVSVGRAAKAGVAGARGLLGLAAEGATTGGLAGVGMSKEGEEVKGAVTGAALGAALMPAVASVASKVATKRPAVISEAEETTQKNIDRVDVEAGARKILEEKAPRRAVMKEAIVNEAPEAVEKLAAKETDETIDAATRLKQAQADIDTETTQFARELAAEVGEDVPSTSGKAKEIVAKFKEMYGPEYLQKKFDIYENNNAKLEFIRSKDVEALPDSSYGLSRIADFISDLRYVYRDIDSKYGVGLESIQNKLNSNYNRYTYAKQPLDEMDSILEKRMRDAELSPEVVADIIDKKLPTADLTPEQRSVVDGYKELFEIKRQTAAAGDKGFDVSGIEISKRENYVPYRVLDLPDLVVAIENKVAGIESDIGKPLSKLTEEEFKTLSATNQEFKDFLAGITYNDAKEVNNTQQLQNALRRAVSPNAAISSPTSLKTRAAFLRDDDAMPEWIREKDIRKLSRGWTQNTMRNLYLKEPLQELVGAAKSLEAMKADRAAKYLNTVINDITGVRGDTLAKAMSNLSAAVKVRAIRAAKAAPEGSKARSFYELLSTSPDMLSAIGNNVYGNYLGANIGSVIRNLSSPLLMNIPELGYKYGTYAATKAYVEAATPAGRQRLLEQMQKYGIGPAKFTGETPEYLKKSIQTHAVYNLGENAVKKMTDAAMYMYEKADVANRMITLSMANTLTDDLISGSRSGLAALSKFPIQIRNEAVRHLQAGDEDKLRRLLAKQFDSMTQFDYNRLSMSELGRTLGPLFSVFSKWPTSIAGDVIQQLREKGAIGGGSDLIQRRLLPVIGLGGIQAALFDSPFSSEEMSDREKKLIGSRGFIGWSPISSLETLTPSAVTSPPAVNAVTSALLKQGRNISEEPGAVLGDIGSNLLYGFVPGMGLVRFITDDMLTLATGERPEGSNFVERTIEGATRLQKK